MGTATKYEAFVSLLATPWPGGDSAHSWLMGY